MLIISCKKTVDQIFRQNHRLQELKEGLDCVSGTNSLSFHTLIISYYESLKYFVLLLVTSCYLTFPLTPERIEKPFSGKSELKLYVERFLIRCKVSCFLFCGNIKTLLGSKECETSIMN